MEDRQVRKASEFTSLKVNELDLPNKDNTKENPIEYNPEHLGYSYLQYSMNDPKLVTEWLPNIANNWVEHLA